MSIHRLPTLVECEPIQPSIFQSGFFDFHRALTCQPPAITHKSKSTQTTRNHERRLEAQAMRLAGIDVSTMHAAAQKRRRFGVMEG